jgi:hypothetical protein
MGGKGGGGGNYYQQPPDTSGYATEDEAKATLAKQAPLDMDSYQSNINAKKAAADATAPTPTVDTSVPDTSLSTQLADSILKPPNYWSDATKVSTKPRTNATGGSALTVTDPQT